jgi:hypothetical protein
MTTVWNLANLGFLIPVAVERTNIDAVVKPFHGPYATEANDNLKIRA